MSFSNPIICNLLKDHGWGTVRNAPVQFWTDHLACLNVHVSSSASTIFEEVGLLRLPMGVRQPWPSPATWCVFDPLEAIDIMDVSAMQRVEEKYQILLTPLAAVESDGVVLYDNNGEIYYSLFNLYYYLNRTLYSAIENQLVLSAGKYRHLGDDPSLDIINRRPNPNNSPHQSVFAKNISWLW